MELLVENVESLYFILENFILDQIQQETCLLISNLIELKGLKQEMSSLKAKKDVMVVNRSIYQMT